MTSSTTQSTRSNGSTSAASDATDAVAAARDAVGAAASSVRDAIDTVGGSMPEVARVSRGLMDDAMRAIERGSDERVSAGVTLSLGLAIGMLIGGAPRLLTIIALIPVAAMGIVLVDRRTATAAKRASAA
jgi:hypothetical protein